MSHCGIQWAVGFSAQGRGRVNIRQAVPRTGARTTTAAPSVMIGAEKRDERNETEADAWAANV